MSDDQWLRDRLQRLAGPAPDDEHGLAAMRARAGARRRRRFGAACATATAAVIAIAALASAGRDGAGELRPATSSPATTPPSATATTRETPPGSTATAAPASITSAPEPSAAATIGSTATVESTATAPATASTSGASSAATSSTVPPSSSAPSPPVTQTYTSLGGSITVRFADGALALLSQSPHAGFSSEVEDNRADRVRVRFRSDAHTSRIEVRVENGTLRPDIDEDGDSSGPG